MKDNLRYLMALLYIAAGINHFFHPGMYRQIMPPWLPFHNFLIYLSGLLEIVLGTLLLVPTVRRIAAWGIVLLLIAVFPANVHMMLVYRESDHPGLWLTILRLPLQALLVWWAFQYTKPNKKENDVERVLPES